MQHSKYVPCVVGELSPTSRCNRESGCEPRAELELTPCGIGTLSSMQHSCQATRLTAILRTTRVGCPLEASGTVCIVAAGRLPAGLGWAQRRHWSVEVAAAAQHAAAQAADASRSLAPVYDIDPVDMCALCRSPKFPCTRPLHKPRPLSSETASLSPLPVCPRVTTVELHAYNSSRHHARHHACSVRRHGTYVGAPSATPHKE